MAEAPENGFPVLTHTEDGPVLTAADLDVRIQDAEERLSDLSDVFFKTQDDLRTARAELSLLNGLWGQLKQAEQEVEAGA